MEELLQKKILTIGSWSLSVATVAGLLVTWLLTWLLLRALHRGLNRRGRLLRNTDEGRRQSFYLIAQYFIWMVSAAVMLEMAGFRITVLLAGSTALLVWLGLGVQPIFRDIVSGIFLLFEGSIEIGDILELDGEMIRVIEINLRTSKMATQEGSVIIVPNHKFITEDLVNWSSRSHHPSRFSVKTGTDYLAPENRVLEILLEAAAAHPEVINDNPDLKPYAYIADFTDDRMIFELQVWTKDKMQSDNILGDLRLAIRQKLSAEGINMSKK